MKILYLPQENIHKGNLILVNAQHPYPAQQDLTLCPIWEGAPSLLMNRCAVVLLTNLMNEIHGWRSILPVSGFRSRKEQQEIWDNALTQEGEDFTKAYVALPGHSEHETGLAVDLGLRREQIDPIRPDFPDSGICGIFRRRAAAFGYIERYPSGKENITGIAAEPWHFRFVGAPHGAVMAGEGLTLEEYLAFIKTYPYGEKTYEYRQAGLGFAISYLKAEKEGSTRLELTGDIPYSISGDNMGGYVITEWRRD